jgi:hypothetical protein
LCGPKSVAMKLCHRAKVRGQGFALACLKLLDEVVHGLLDKLLRWVVFLAGALLIRRLAAVLPCRIIPVRRGVGDNGCTAHGGCHCAVPRLLPAVGRSACMRESTA